MKQVSSLSVLAFLFLSLTSIQAAVTTSVNWGAATGKNASGAHAGLNLFQGFDPSVAGTSGNTTYKTNLAAMKPGFVRYHRWDMIEDSSTNTSGWATGLGAGQTVGWDASRINSAMSGMNTWGGTLMMNIPGWPDKWKVSGSEKLDPSHYADFANWCASLVQIVNLDQNRAVVYWEVTNERDDTYSTDTAELGRIYNQAAAAMRLKDSSIKVGGPAFARPDLIARVDGFFSTAAPNLDFVSYHSYSSGSTGDSNQTIFNSAAGLGDITASVKTEYAKYSSRAIQYYHDEYNISWNPPDSRMNNEIGMVFDALSIASIINGGADAAMAWNEADGWYGKLDPSYGKRSAAYLFEIFNTDLGGAVVNTSTSDASRVVLLGTKGGSWVKLALINRSEADETAIFSAVSGLPSGASDSTSFTMKQIFSWGVSFSDVTVGQLKAGLALPANTVTMLVLDTSTISVATGSLSLNSAAAPAAVNLASQGSADWSHWGLSTTVSFSNHALDRKSGGNQIGDFTALVADTVERITDFPTEISWTGGTPTDSATNTKTGVQIYRWWSEGNGFQIVVPAGTTQRTLKLYCGTFNSNGRITASLSDNSAASVTDTLAGSGYNVTDRVYTIVFQAGLANQSLTVRFTETENLGSYSPSAVRLAGAALY